MGLVKHWGNPGILGIFINEGKFKYLATGERHGFFAEPFSRHSNQSWNSHPVGGANEQGGVAVVFPGNSYRPGRPAGTVKSLSLTGLLLGICCAKGRPIRFALRTFSLGREVVRFLRVGCPSKGALTSESEPFSFAPSRLQFGHPKSENNWIAGQLISNPERQCCSVNTPFHAS